jgi:hypothetical protein
VFNLSAAAIGHPYWSINGDANARWAQFIGFWKDIGLAGGALFLLARGAGRLSLDRNPERMSLIPRDASRRLESLGDFTNSSSETRKERRAPDP